MHQIDVVLLASADTGVTTEFDNRIGVGQYLDLDWLAHWENVVANVNHDGICTCGNFRRKASVGLDADRTDDMVTLRELNVALHGLQLTIWVAGLLDRAGGAGKRVAIDSTVRTGNGTVIAAARDQRCSNHND